MKSAITSGLAPSGCILCSVRLLHRGNRSGIGTGAAADRGISSGKAVVLRLGFLSATDQFFALDLEFLSTPERIPVIGQPDRNNETNRKSITFLDNRIKLSLFFAGGIEYAMVISM